MPGLVGNVDQTAGVIGGVSGLPYLRGVSLRREAVPSYDAYPFSIPAVHELRSIEFHRDVTFIVGENGCGKSTLLEAIASAQPAGVLN